jgi:hypothetical protein
MSVSTTTIAYALKTVYTNRELENAVYKDNPLFAMMRKEGGFTGSSHIHGVRYRDSLARSVDFATAQGRAGSNGASGTDNGFTLGVQFIVTRRKEYQIYTLSQEAILAGRDDKGSLIRTLSTEVDSALNNLNRTLGQSVYGDGLGGLGAINSIGGATNRTIGGTAYANSRLVTVGEAITNFEVGHQLMVSDTTKTGAIRAGSTMTVLSVDRSAGTFIIDAGVAGIAAGDWFFHVGDRDTGSAPANSALLKLAGLDAWNPVTAPSAGESFFGVDRSRDVTRLAGQRLDISSLQPEEGYITALAALAREGSSPSHIFTSFTDEKNLKLAVGSRVETEYSQVGDVGFESMKVRGPKGIVKLYADLNAPVGYARLLQMDTWAFKHLGDLVNTADMDGSRLAREYRADAFEGRMSVYGNVVCYAPSKNMVATLPT